MQAPYDRQHGQAPGGGDDGWLPGQQAPADQQGRHPGEHEGPWGPAPAPPDHDPEPPEGNPRGGPYPGPGTGTQAAGDPPGPFSPGQYGADRPYPPQPYAQPHPPHGDPAGHSGFTGGQDTRDTGYERQQNDDAFAYLFRDQQAAPRRPGPHPQASAPEAIQAAPPAPPAPPPPLTPPAPPRPTWPAPPSAQEPAGEPAGRRTGRAASLLRSSAVMAAGTLVSRITGFIRQLVMVAALGAAVLADTYSVAWALPNMIYILTIGGGLNSVFVPQLVRAMKNDPDGGEAYANRLLTLVMAALGGLVIVAVLAAPLLVRLMSAKIANDPAANEVAVTFARYCLPTIFFMGVHVVLGQILNARGRFGPMMWTPVLNNVVVIFTFGMFLWVYGTQTTSGMTTDTITPEGVRLLGVGTLLGLTVQALAMIPYMRAAGFRIRLRFDWRGHGMGKAARLAKWTVLFVLANQAGVVVITQLATWAGENAEDAGYPGTGYTAYSSALLIWQMPQAIITVSVMAALLPRLSRSAADGDTAAVRDDLSHGLRTSAVAIVPLAFAFLALGVPMCTLLFGSSGEESARSFGYILMAFGVGLIPYSAQYVVLRVFYAYEDTRTPFSNTVIVSAAWIALSVLSFVALPDRWVVAGIAFSYGIAYALGISVAWRRLRRRLRTDLDGARIVRTYVRLAGASIPAALAGSAAGIGILRALGEGLLGSLAAVTVGGTVLLGVFFLAARRMRVEELTTLIGMIRARLGR